MLFPPIYLINIDRPGPILDSRDKEVKKTGKTPTFRKGSHSREGRDHMN